MSSGWGCQYLTKFEEHTAWCRLLKHKCEPSCKGCILYGKFTFSEPNIESNPNNVGRKRKNRSDNPLG